MAIENEAESVESLAAIFPRVLIDVGLAEGLAAEWLRRVPSGEAGAGSESAPPWPRYDFAPALADALFEARRARQLVRGLEASGEALDRQEAGLSRAGATRPVSRRISRLLVLAADGAPRFYRQAQRLVERHAVRMAGIVVEADEDALGEAVFGRGHRVRAVLLDHKEAVVRLLERLPGAEPATEE